jgi:glycerophosphoryl diester phosphodiesterase
MKAAWDPHRFVAHRGFRRLYPENSLASFKAAYLGGALFAECDIQLSQDQIPMIYHDPTLRRVSGRAGKVWEYQAALLEKMPASEAGRLGKAFPKERIARLASLAAWLKGRPRGTLFVELKEESIPPFGRLNLLTAVHQALAPIRKRCVLISFDWEILRLARHLCDYPLGWVIRNWMDLKTKAYRELKAEYIFSGTEMLPKRGRLSLGKAKHVVYEVPDPERGEELLKRGVDMIESFALDAYLKIK